MNFEIPGDVPLQERAPAPKTPEKMSTGEFILAVAERVIPALLKGPAGATEAGVREIQRAFRVVEIADAPEPIEATEHIHIDEDELIGGIEKTAVTARKEIHVHEQLSEEQTREYAELMAKEVTDILNSDISDPNESLQFRIQKAFELLIDGTRETSPEIQLFETENGIVSTQTDSRETHMGPGGLQ